MELKQSPWMKRYINLNAKLRTEAKTDFEHDLFKLANNSVFGKAMENQQNRVDVKILRRSGEAKRLKLLAKPCFDRVVPLPSDLKAVHIFLTNSN